MDRSYSHNTMSLYLLLFCLAALSFSPVAAWISPLRRDWIVLFIAVFCIFDITKSFSYGESTKLLLIYGVVVLVNAAMGDKLFSSIPVGIVEILLLYVPSSVALWFISKKQTDFVKRILILSLFFLVVEGVASYMLNLIYPSLMRTIYSVAHKTGDINFQYSYYRYGLMDYSMPHAVPILIMPLFYLYKSANYFKTKIISAFGIVFCVFITWLSDSTTALMLSILMVGIGFITKVGDTKSNSRKLLLIMILATPILASDDVQLYILDTAENILGSESVFADKIDEIRSSILYEETGYDMQERADRYQKSFDMFIHSPIWGGNKEVGNHASILDRMGALGLIGFIPLFLFFKTSLTEIKNSLPQSSHSFFYGGIFAAVVMLGVKGMWYWPIFFCLYILLPSIIIYANHNNPKQ